MNRRIVRRLALALIAFLAFAQASVVLAGCTMERGEMAQMAAMDGDCCGDAEMTAPEPQLDNQCVAHCTADLQLSGVPVALVHQAADIPVLLLPRLRLPDRAVAVATLACAIPSRILLHSFLI